MFVEALKRHVSITKSKNFYPRTYQEHGIKFIVDNLCAGLFLAPGLGKTAIVLHAFKILKQKRKVSKILVVSKLRIIFGVWPVEVKKWGLSFSVGMLHGPKKEIVLREKHDIYLINYEGLFWLFKQDKYLNMFDMLIIDESSKMKNTSTKRFKLIKKYLSNFKRRIILTGSPAPNSLEDIFGQIYILDQGKTLGKYITKFRTDYFMPYGYMGYQWKIIPGQEKVIYEKIKPLVLRYGHDTVDLPPLHKVIISVTLDKKSMQKYRAMEKEFIIELQNGENILAINAASASSKMRQITGGHIYNESKKVYFIHDEKIEYLAELIDELQGSPVLIAYEFNHELNSLLKKFPNAEYIGKGVNVEKGNQIQHRWNRGEVPILLGQTSALSHGLNLQGGPCRDVAFYTLTWNLEDYEQFIQRVWRSGQKESVTVHHIIAEKTIDELVLSVLYKKDKVQKNLLDAMRAHYLRQ